MHKNIGEKISVFDSKFDHNIGFWEKTPIFSPKIENKSQKNCDYNIDPSFASSAEFLGPRDRN
jgi:hypothetical protein